MSVAHSVCSPHCMACLQQGVTPSVTAPYSVPSCCTRCGVNQYLLVSVLYVHICYTHRMVSPQDVGISEMILFHPSMRLVCVYVCMYVRVCVHVCMCSCVDCIVRCIQSPFWNPEPQCHALVLYCHAVQSLNYEKPDNEVPAAEKRNISKWTSVSLRF